MLKVAGLDQASRQPMEEARTFTSTAGASDLSVHLNHTIHTGKETLRRHPDQASPPRQRAAEHAHCALPDCPCSSGRGVLPACRFGDDVKCCEQPIQDGLSAQRPSAVGCPKRPRPGNRRGSQPQRTHAAREADPGDSFYQTNTIQSPAHRESCTTEPCRSEGSLCDSCSPSVYTTLDGAERAPCQIESSAAVRCSKGCHS